MVVQGARARGHDVGSEVALRRIRPALVEVAAEQQLVALHPGDLALAQLGGRAGQLVAAQRDLGVGEVAGEHEAQGAADRGDRVVGRLGVQVGVDPLDEVLVVGEDDGVLGGEVVEEGAAPDPCGLGDGVDRGGGVALALEEVHRGVRDPPPGVPATGCRFGLHRRRHAHSVNGSRVGDRNVH